MSSSFPQRTVTAAQDELPPVLIALMKGVLYREFDLRLWNALLRMRSESMEYMARIALVLHIDEVEGYAYLRNREALPGEDEHTPRLLPRRQLGYNESLLLALLRKRLAEFDVSATDSRLVLRDDEVYELLAWFLPEASDEVKLRARVDKSMDKLVDMGFLRRLQANGEHNTYEVLRVIKAFIDAEWLNGLDAGLATYRTHESEKQSS